MKKITVSQWKEMFTEAGLSEEDMQKWHQIFENKHPDGHQSFFEWLGLEETRIKEIRQSFK